MKRVLSIFIVIATVANVVLPQAWAAQDPEICSLQALPEEMNAFDTNTRRLKFGPQQLEYLRLNRDNLRTTYQRQLQAAIGADHYVYRELLGLFSDKHVLAYGGPGGAKSAGSNLLYIPTQAGNDLILDPSVYKIQMNPFTTDLSVKGRYDEATRQLLNYNTMVQFERVLVDEVDKMPPQVGPAFNDLLNERAALHGPMQVRAETRHVLFTSNQTAYGLMNAWRTMDPGNGEQQARAFVARIPIRVFVDNYERSTAGRGQLLRMGVSNEASSAFELLTNPAEVFRRYRRGFQAEEVPPRSYGYSPVDFTWLRTLAYSGGFQLNAGGESTLNALADMVRVRFNQMAMDSEKKVEDEQQGIIYMPPSGVSNRDLVQNLPTLMINSLMLDLLLLPESILPTEMLAQGLERGLPVDASSAWRAQYHLLTGSPGDATLNVERSATGGAPTYTVAFDNSRLLNIQESPSSIYEKTTVEYILQERQVFQSAFESVISNGQTLSEQSASQLERMRPVLGESSGGALHSAEELYFKLKQRMQGSAR